MKPDIVDWDAALVLELVRPFATVLILDVFPFWSHALLEKMVIGFERKLRGWSDVILD